MFAGMTDLSLPVPKRSRSSRHTSAVPHIPEARFITLGSLCGSIDLNSESAACDDNVSFRGPDCSSTQVPDLPFPSTLPVPTPTPRSRLTHHLRRLGWPLLLGQLLSALIAVTGIASNYLVTFGVSIPLMQNLPSYVLLAVVYGLFSWPRLFAPTLHGSRPQPPDESGPISPQGDGDNDSISFSEVAESVAEEDTVFSKFGSFIKTRGWHYFIAGTIDVHANWAIVSAYNFTNLTSIQLLDCLTIPTAMLLSRIFLKTHYRWMHVLGVVVCLGGAGVMVGADYLAAASAKQPSSNSTNLPATTSSVLLGDFLVIIGAVGYGMSNVYQEHLVRRFGIVDYLGFVSVSATAWTLFWTLTLEYKTIVELIARPDQSNQGASLGCISGFAAAMFLLYTVMPFALSRTNAVLVNLSLLTADVYALLIGIFLFQNTFQALYLGAFAVIIVGICTFASRDPIFSDSVNNKSEDGA